MSKRILITGSHGFVGNHLTRYLLDNTDWEIVGLDSFRHKELGWEHPIPFDETLRMVVEWSRENEEWL